MAKTLNMFVLATLTVVGALFQGSEAQTTHTVGGSTGWTIPSGGAATYTTWASQQTFAIGDILVFNFAASSHDVAEVTKEAYNNCTTASPITTITTAPARFTLTSVGEHYFICTFSGHCNAGQKLTVTVSNASTATPPASTATPPSTTASPPLSAAPSPLTAATPPPTPATPPPTPATMPPPSTATPPTGSAASPTDSVVPSSQSPSGSNVPPPPSSATSLAATALPMAILSFALAFMY